MYTQHERRMAARVAKCIVFSKSDALGDLNRGDPTAIARLRYGEQSTIARFVQRAAVGDDWSSALEAEPDFGAFVEAVREREVLGRLPGLRRLAPRTRHLVSQFGATAHFVAEDGAIPVSEMDLAGEDYKLRRVAGIVVASNEALRRQDFLSDDNLSGDMVRALAEATDRALLDPANDGADEEPEAITHDAPEVVSSGDAMDDFSKLFQGFGGDLLTSAVILHPLIAVQLAASGNSAFERVGATGGEMFGLPVLTTRMCPLDSSGGLIALIDGAGISASEEAPFFDLSRGAMLEMNTAPTGSTTTPTAATATRVGLFQAEATAIKVIRRIIWKRFRDNAVSIITGADYAGNLT